MTTPHEPVRGSDTGWPSEPARVSTPAPVAPPAAVPPPPLTPPPAPPATPPPPAGASESPSVESAPVVPEPDPAAAAPVSVETAPVVGRSDEDTPAASEPARVAAAPVVGSSDEAAPAVAAPARPRGAWRSPAVLALLLTTVLMAVAAGFVWYQVHQKDATETARRAGLETSRDAARVLFSYDYRTLDKDFAAGKAITTGAFQKSYGDTTSKVVGPVARDKKAVVKAEVVSAGVVRASPTSVVTVVFVNQVTTSSLATAPKVDLSRVRMTVKRVGGRWLVSNVTAL